MADAYTVSAVSAAVDVAHRYGLPTEDLQVLHERSNVLVRLGPVVARVPATTRLMRTDPGAALARDVAVSRFLTARGVRVVSPTSDPPPGPHTAGGLPVTLWRYTPHAPDYRFSPAQVAGSLAEVHAARREYRGELPSDGPLAEVYRMLDRLEDAFEGHAPRLRGAADRIATTMPSGPVQALHGDAHAGNLLATPEGPCWLDFEDTWRGPLGWDLGVLSQMREPHGPAYPGAPDQATLTPFTELRKLFGVCWQFVVSQRFPARLTEARERLAKMSDP